MAQLRNVAVVGFAQAPIVARDEHRISTEILYPQVRRVLADCGVDRDAIDYQVAGSADYVDGRPFGFVAALDVTGSWPPRQDLHLEMDAAFAAHYAWIRMQTGECDTALVCGYGKNSEGESERVQNLELDPYYHAPLGLGPTATAALQASAYMARTGAGDRDLAEVAARNRAAGARNPDTLLRTPASAEELARTPWAVAPLRRGYLPAVGDSAVCLLLAAEGRAEAMCERPVWIHGVDQRIELQTIGARDLSRSAGARLAAEKALAMAGLSRARDVDVVELAATTPTEELILREVLALDGELPVNPSGGPLCGHPFMMTGLIRLGEAFRQVADRAGDHGVPHVRRALAHASQGHCLQQNLFFVLGSERRWS
ncbi:MAG TPA: lipid-transfer protein [Candidatus Binatia bacterium]|nr:lipid-transfer protein [Candidatus Binatia bacterium]